MGQTRLPTLRLSAQGCMAGSSTRPFHQPWRPCSSHCSRVHLLPPVARPPGSGDLVKLLELGLRRGDWPHPPQGVPRLGGEQWSEDARQDIRVIVLSKGVKCSANRKLASIIHYLVFSE